MSESCSRPNLRSPCGNPDAPAAVHPTRCCDWPPWSLRVEPAYLPDSFERLIRSTHQTSTRSADVLPIREITPPILGMGRRRSCASVSVPRWHAALRNGAVQPRFLSLLHRQISSAAAVCNEADETKSPFSLKLNPLNHPPCNNALPQVLILQILQHTSSRKRISRSTSPGVL